MHSFHLYSTVYFVSKFSRKYISSYEFDFCNVLESKENEADKYCDPFFFNSYGIFRTFYSFGQSNPLSALKDAESYMRCISNTEKECFKVMKVETVFHV